MKKSMSAFRDEVQQSMQQPFTELLATYLMDLHVTEDPEVRRRGLEFLAKTMGLEPEKKVDPYAGLATITVNIGAGGIHAQLQQAKEIPVEDAVYTQQDAIEDARQTLQELSAVDSPLGADPDPVLDPVPAMMRMLEINLDALEPLDS